MRGFRRIAVLSLISLALAAAVAGPGGAQTTTETSIAYAAESSSAGIKVAITPPGAPAPAGGIFGAATDAEITSDGPSAKGRADALALLPAASPVSAVTEAPPDSGKKSATSPIPAITIPSVGTVAALQGTATSESEAQDESPSSANEATVGALSISVNTLPALPVLGTVSASVNVAQMKTHANAQAPKEKNVSADAGSAGVAISADLDITGLSAVCGLIPVPQLQTACGSLAGTGQVINIVAGPSTVGCTWNGKQAACDGSASTATVTLAGQAPVTVAPGQTATIPDADPFLVRVIAGDANDTVEGDSGSIIAAGLSIELIGTSRANPGLIQIAIGESTAGVSGEITTDETIARTGGPLLPLFFGGTAFIAAGYGLRRFLKRS